MVHKKKKSVCMLCGKPSSKSICDACGARVQGEALGKQKNDKPKK
jgi:ribosomal protein L40E